MNREETMISFPGEVQDMVAWKAISNGAQQKITLSYDDIMELK